MSNLPDPTTSGFLPAQPPASPRRPLDLRDGCMPPSQRPDPMRVVRVGIVEDEALMRGLLEQTLSAEPSLSVVHSVPGAAEARLVFTPGSVDVALLDVHLPDGNGVALGVQLQRQDPDLAVMLLSSEDVMRLFTSVQREVSKPWSYLSKRSSFTRDELVHAITASAEGRAVLDPCLVQRCMPRANSAVSELTSAQFRVLRLVAEGLSNQTLAERLGISKRSVEAHLKSVYEHLNIDGSGTNRRVAAVLAFIEQAGGSWRP